MGALTQSKLIKLRGRRSHPKNQPHFLREEQETVLNNDLQEFKDLYFEEYKITLTNEEISTFSMRLIGLVKAVHGDNPSEALIKKVKALVKTTEQTTKEA